MTTKLRNCRSLSFLTPFVKQDALQKVKPFTYRLQYGHRRRPQQFLSVFASDPPLLHEQLACGGQYSLQQSQESTQVIIIITSENQACGLLEALIRPKAT